ncbi:MAG: tRNA(Ile)-lysidine synthase [Methanoregula sp.]
MQCSKCSRTAVIFQEYSGQHLCSQHFDADVEAKAKHEIRRHHWLSHGDHIAVALSGDSGSSALLYFLKKLTSNRRDIQISAISVDEGIAGYRCPEDSVRTADLLHAECIIGSFQEVFGTTMDEIACIKGNAISCTYCRVIRNFLLNRIALEHGITKLAFGWTLDDEAGSVLKNVLGGTPEILVHSERGVRGKIPRILPFIAVPKKEVELYSGLHVGRYNQSRCPYSNTLFEEDTKEMLDEFAIRHPATKYALLGLEKNLAGACVSMADSRSSCERCGEPAEGICESCRIIGEVTGLGA